MTTLDHLGTAALVLASLLALTWCVFGAELASWLTGVRNRRHIARCRDCSTARAGASGATRPRGGGELPRWAFVADVGRAQSGADGRVN